MDRLLAHRGPDGHGAWTHGHGHVGLAHRRLSVIDLTTGGQPMHDGAGNWITYNGEIYNYRELRSELSGEEFRTTSDTEVLLRAYRRWGIECVSRLRGMFSFALWDEAHSRLFCARDRFGIKPYCYAQVGDTLFFASEAKALLPFLEDLEVDHDGLRDYLAFQFFLDGKTLFRGIRELLPGHILLAEGGRVTTRRYWEVYYDLDFDHTERHFEHELRARLEDSVAMHLRSDVPVGAYLSGGLDSSAIAAVGRQRSPGPFMAFAGRFREGPEYDESHFARLLAEQCDIELQVLDITLDDFLANIRKVVYHLDFPVAGPGAFSQYMVSGLAARHRKVVLGGQGGDEIFGGYARYLIAYFEQCLKAAIDGTMQNGNFIVTYTSIIPNLRSLQNYKPLLKQFWSRGLFDDMDHRYFALVNRTPELSDEVRWETFGEYSPFESFQRLFHSANVGKESYFDLMTHFDFKTLLPALLQVEDRVSMAHGVESRVPLLDHPLVELAATVPASIKFKDGTMKHVFREVVRPLLPGAILARKDKMGFPTPFSEWSRGGARDFIRGVFSTPQALTREFIDNHAVLRKLDDEPKFGRKLWGLLSLELWQQEFIDSHARFRALLDEPGPTEVTSP